MPQAEILLRCRKRRGLYGEVPGETASVPPAVVGTFPYNLLNGTAWARLLLLWNLNIWERGAI
jgi:hypothetical protein